MNYTDIMEMGLFAPITAPISDRYSEMQNDQWSTLCKKYINQLMLEQLFAEDEESLSSFTEKTEFLISTLRAHHACRTGNTITGIPIGKNSFDSDKAIVIENARNLLKAADKSNSKGGDTENSTFCNVQQVSLINELVACRETVNKSLFVLLCYY